MIIVMHIFYDPPVHFHSYEVNKVDIVNQHIKITNYQF